MKVAGADLLRSTIRENHRVVRGLGMAFVAVVVTVVLLGAFVYKHEPTINGTSEGSPSSLNGQHSFRPILVTSLRSSDVPSEYPSYEPSAFPSDLPSSQPTLKPSPTPSFLPTASPTFLSFLPGTLNVYENGLVLSQGLTSRVVATTGQPVQFHANDADNGGDDFSQEVVHTQPDGGATFPDTRASNLGGWIYVSNSEDLDDSRGGVGAFTFDSQGNAIDYRMLLNGTTANCGGGMTDWNSWVSCEETRGGVLWQVDPFGVRDPEIISLGSDGGVFESFAYDLLTQDAPQFFVTEDQEDGALQRWQPDNPDWTDPWSVLMGSGRTDFLLLSPLDSSSGTFTWTTDRDSAKKNAAAYFPHSEGMDCVNATLYFITKELKRMYILDLVLGTYVSQSTTTDTFDGQPDQIQRAIRNDDEMLFFTEDGGRRPGVHARTKDGTILTILESTAYPIDYETTGLAFSPDGKHMYFAIQDAGLIYDVARMDGLPFNARSLNMRYPSRN